VSRSIALGRAAQERNIRLRLVVGVEPDWVLRSYACHVAEPQHEYLGELVNGVCVSGTDRRRVDDLSLDQLDAAVLVQDASLGHPVVLVDGESVLRDLDCHRRPQASIIADRW